jgi:hypothetical protein
MLAMAMSSSARAHGCTISAQSLGKDQAGVANAEQVAALQQSD